MSQFMEKLMCWFGDHNWAVMHIYGHDLKKCFACPATKVERCDFTAITCPKHTHNRLPL